MERLHLHKRMDHKIRYWSLLAFTLLPRSPAPGPRRRPGTHDYNPPLESGPILWQGPPGPWPDTSITDVITEYINGAVNPPIPASPDAPTINDWGSRYTPPNTVVGTLISDSGIPSGWCWW
jgi:hypothetical protein